jgi:hypothetical protein
MDVTVANLDRAKASVLSAGSSDAMALKIREISDANGFEFIYRLESWVDDPAAEKLIHAELIRLAVQRTG